jgi:hypothetical protein
LVTREFHIYLNILQFAVSYRAFEKFLDPERYTHLKALAFIAHIVEEQYLSSNGHKDVKYLATHFDKNFAFLYTVNNIFCFVSLFMFYNAG